MVTRTLTNTEFGHIDGCKILRVEDDDASLEFRRCAPACPHGEVVLMRPDEGEQLKR
jgi:hypothetical protein